MNDLISPTRDLKNIKELSSGEHTLNDVLSKLYPETAICSLCGELKSNSLDVESIYHSGVCLECDHVLTDVEVRYE